MRGRTAVLLALTILGATLSLPAGVSAQETSPPPAEAAAQETSPPPAEASAQETPPPVGAAAYPDGLVHTVVQGDTLWDLSAKYLGSPWLWPELWERNRFLTNPHYIYPGVRVVIFPPPSREYTLPAEKAPAAPPAEPAKIALPEVKPEPPAPKPRTLAILPSEFVRAGIFMKEKPAGIGTIRGGDEPKAAFSEGDRVLLKLDKEIPAGQLLGVYRVRGPITTPGDRPVTGYVKYLAGIIHAGGKEGSDEFGVVRTSFEDLDRQDMIFEEIPSYAPIVLVPAAEGTTANVIAGQLGNEEQYTGNFIFLDRGSSSGIAPGNGFRLYDVVDESEGDRMVKKTAARIEVGEAVVVRVSPEYSTAYIVKCSRSFPAGILAFAGTGPGKGK